jgi:hypothetical protein
MTRTVRRRVTRSERRRMSEEWCEGAPAAGGLVAWPGAAVVVWCLDAHVGGCSYLSGDADCCMLFHVSIVQAGCWGSQGRRIASACPPQGACAVQLL